MVDVEQELFDILNEEIRKERQIELKIMKRVNEGWTLVQVDNSVDFANIEEWIATNIRDEWRAYDNRWIFKDSQEALLFKYIQLNCLFVMILSFINGFLKI
jgi:hypothetical protein